MIQPSFQTVRFSGQQIAPTKILCIGRNYVDHIKELDNEEPDSMVIFSKPNSAIGCNLLSHAGEPLHYESEISYLIEDGNYVAVAFGFDLTKRALQTQLKSKGLPWERAKAFDGAALFSDFVALDASWGALSLQMQVDNVITQQGGVELMINKPQDILEELQAFTTLVDGDIVMTGTPAGVGAIQSGSVYTGSLYAGSTLLLQTQWTAR